MNYTSLSKERLFIITVIYPAISNVFLDINIPRIIIMVNPTSKVFILNKGICLGSIYKCINILYIITNITKTFTVVVIASTTVFELFTIIQKAVMFGFRYLRVLLISALCQNDILGMNTEFIFMLKVKVILIAEYVVDPNLDLCPDFESIFYINNFLKPASFIPVSNTIYIIL